MKEIIELKNISKSYGNEIIIEKLNYTFYTDEIVVILGYSGVGKSTLIRILAGLDLDYNGAIDYLENIDVTKDIIPVVFQNFNQLLPWYTVRKNILLPYKKDHNKLQIFNEIIEILELKGALDKYPKALSGGMKQRTAIARALLAESKVIFFDEPFSSLDITMRQNLQDLIIKIQKKYNQTIIFITHDIDEAVFLADRLLIMKDSKTRYPIKLKSKHKKRHTEAFDQQIKNVRRIIQGSRH